MGAHLSGRPQCRGRQLPGAEVGPSFPGSPALGDETWGWLWPPASLMMLPIQRGLGDLVPPPHSGHSGLCGHRRKHWPDGLQGWWMLLSMVLTGVSLPGVTSKSVRFAPCPHLHPAGPESCLHTQGLEQHLLRPQSCSLLGTPSLVAPWGRQHLGLGSPGPDTRDAP